MKLDFAGLGSRVQFEKNGDRIATVTISNIRYPSSFKVHTIQDVSVTHVIGIYKTDFIWYEKPVFYDGVTVGP